MQQLRLFEYEQIKEVSIPHINMQIFPKKENCDYRDWLLEINSNKFWIKLWFENWSYDIDSFQIIAAKWYFEMNLAFIKTLRNIVFNLYTKLINE